MAVPVVVTGSVTTTAPTGATTIAATKPTGVVAGDLLVAALGMRGTGTVNSVPSGWTQRDTRVSTTGTVMRIYFYTYGPATGSDPASWTWGFTASQPATAVLYRVTGADTASPFDVATGVSPAANALTFTLPGFTTTGADRLLLFGGIAGNAPTYTSVTGMAEFYDASAGSGTSQRAAGGYQEDFPTAGAVADKTITISASQPFAGSMIAVKPSGAAAPADPDILLTTQPLIFY